MSDTYASAASSNLANPITAWLKNWQANQGKVIRAHDQAVQAKWLASLLLRLKDADLDASMECGKTKTSLREIAERLKSACYVNTPEPALDTLSQYGIDGKSVLNPAVLALGLHATVLYADPSFNWREVATILEVGFNFPSLHKDTCARFGFTWQEREQMRFALGEYKPLPWAGKLPVIENHFTHPSMEEKGLLAYTENSEKGERDVQKRIKPGRYLKEFYPNLAGAEIEQLQAKVISAEVQFTSDADEIEAIYVKGPGSCMAGTLGRPKGQHPTRGYAGGDLAVAYILNKDGKYAARSIVWPGKKVYYYAYGDCGRLHAALEALGYRQGGQYCFQGARMRKQPCKDQPGFVLMPAFDGHGCFRVDPQDEDFVIVDKSGPLACGGGVLKVPVSVTCGCGCGKKTSGPIEVHANGAHKPAQHWAPGCLKLAQGEGRIAICAHTGKQLPKECLTPVYWGNRREAVQVCLASRQTNCIKAANGRWYRTGAFRLIQLDSGEVWQVDDLQAAGTHVLVDGLWVSKEAAMQAA